MFASRRTCATSASRSPPSPPTIPRRAGGRWRRSSSSTRCSTPVLDPEAVIAGIDRADPPRRQRAAPAADRVRRPVGHRRRRRRGHVRDRHAGPGVPRARGGAGDPRPRRHGVELHIATQWLHEDRKQIAACLGLPEEQVRLVLAGVGGAFGAREDISLQVHTCLLALRLGRPVRMQYSRAESFLGHVHRHPATIWMRHHATRRRRDRQDRGPLRARRRRLRLDLVGRAAQRDHPHAGPVPLPRTRSSRVGRSAPTTCRAGRCAASASCRRASPTSRSSTAGRGVRARPGRDPGAQRDPHRRSADHRAGAARTWRRSSAACARPRRCRSPTSRSAVSTAIRSGSPAARAAPPTPTTSCAASGTGRR